MPKNKTGSVAPKERINIIYKPATGNEKDTARSAQNMDQRGGVTDHAVGVGTAHDQKRGDGLSVVATAACG